VVPGPLATHAQIVQGIGAGVRVSPGNPRAAAPVRFQSPGMGAGDAGRSPGVDVSGDEASRAPGAFESASWVTRTALCAEPRGGRLHLFMPPLARLEDYLALVAAIANDPAKAAELILQCRDLVLAFDVRLREAGARIGLVVAATIVGMAFGGYISGVIYDATSSYRMAFLNGLAWNMLNVLVIVWLVWKKHQAQTVPA
jgi:hypothetical protein